MSKIADDSASIAQRLKELEAERLQAVTGSPVHIQHDAATGETLEYPYPYYGSDGDQPGVQPSTRPYANAANQGYANSLPGLSNNGINPCNQSGFTQGYLWQIADGGLSTFNLPDVRGRVKASD